MKGIPEKNPVIGLVQGSVVSVCINSIFVLAHWWAVSPHGSSFGLHLAVMLAVPILAAVLAVPISLLMAIPRNTRKRALYIAAFALAYAAVGVAAVRFSRDLRTHAFFELAERSAPLVEAISQFEADHGLPPNRLQDLVPGYLEAVPSTGMGAYPQFEYLGRQGKEEFLGAPWPEGNSWILYVETPSGGINWDLFIYFPSGQYPDYAYSSRLERIGAWAYCHE